MHNISSVSMIYPTVPQAQRLSTIHKMQEEGKRNQGMITWAREENEWDDMRIVKTCFTIRTLLWPYRASLSALVWTRRLRRRKRKFWYIIRRIVLYAADYEYIGILLHQTWAESYNKTTNKTAGLVISTTSRSSGEARSRHFSCRFFPHKSSS